MISYEDWHKRIEDSLQTRNTHWNGDKAWRRFIALYRGDHWRTSKYNSSYLEPDSESPRDRITVNVTGSTVLLAKSFLVSKKNPKFIIKPRRVLEAIEVAQLGVNSILQQESLNYEWQERNMDFQIREAVLDAVVIGHGITKTGFIRRKATAKSENKDGSIEYREYIADESPYLERVNPFRFLFDTEHENYRQLDSGSWCAEIIFRTRQDVLADDRFNQKILKGIKSGVELPETVSLKPSDINNYRGGGGDKDFYNRDILYEVWDKKYRMFYIFIKGIEKPLYEEPWPYEYLDGFPYNKLDFIPVPNEHYGIGIPYFIEDQQLELNRVRTTMFDHRRRFNRKYLAIQGAIEPEEVNKIITGETGAFAWVNQQNAVMPMQEGTIPKDSFNVEGVIKSDINELSGVDKLARGGDLPSRTSAAEIQARQQYTNLKLDDRSLDVDNFYINNGRKVLQHIKANYSQERVIQIAGIKGVQWVKFSPEDIKGEFDIEMDSVAAPQVDEVADRQQRIQIFQLLMQNMQMIMQAQIPINWTEMFKWLLESFGEKDISRFFGAPPVQPGAEQQQPNTALNLMEQGSQSPPNVMNASDMRAGMQGMMAGNVGTNPIPGVQ